MTDVSGSVRTSQISSQPQPETDKPKTEDKPVTIDARPDSNLSGRKVEVPKQGGFKGFLNAVKAFFTRKAGTDKVDGPEKREVAVPKESKFKAFFKAIANLFKSAPKLTPEQTQHKALVDKMSKAPPQFLKEAITSDGPLHYEGEMTGKAKEIILDNYQGITKDFGDVTKDKDGVVVSSVFHRDVTRGMAEKDNFVVTDKSTGQSVSMGQVKNKDGNVVAGYIETDKDGNKTVKEGDCRPTFQKLTGGDPEVVKHLSFYMGQTLPLTMLQGASNLPCFSGGTDGMIAINGVGNIPMKHEAVLDGDKIILKTSISGNLSNVLKNDDNEQFMAFLKGDTSRLEVGWTIELSLSDLKEGNGKFTVVEPLHFSTDLDVDWTMTQNMNG